MCYKIKSFLTNMFGWIAFLAWTLLLLCAFMFSYVGVKIQYILVPLAFLSTLLWWLIHPDKKTRNEN